MTHSQLFLLIIPHHTWDWLLLTTHTAALTPSASITTNLAATLGSRHEMAWQSALCLSPETRVTVNTHNATHKYLHFQTRIHTRQTQCRVLSLSVSSEKLSIVTIDIFFFFHGRGNNVVSCLEKMNDELLIELVRNHHLVLYDLSQNKYMDNSYKQDVWN